MAEGYKFNDGGRKAAGYKGDTGDCVCRAICVITGKSYQEVYDFLANGNASQRLTKRSRKPRARSAAQGIMVKRKWFRDYMASLGFEWVPTMKIGQGCKVHLDAKELPAGRIVIALSKHYTAMIDGVINDTYDPRRQIIEVDAAGVSHYLNSRCVYGYWLLKEVSSV